MQILTVDIGTGTQDVLLFDSERTPENCLKLVVPSPTLALSQQVRAATAARKPLLIQGTLMGGGPVSWAVSDHRKAGLRVLSTPDPARTFNDDLDAVERELGIELIPPEAARKLLSCDDYAHVVFRDFDYGAIRSAFAAFGVDLRPDAVALAVFDHGAAPPGVSDRLFRMEYLAARLGDGRPLSALAFRAADVPPAMTRLQALAATAVEQAGAPVYVMDTAPAAVLGALDDPFVAQQPAPIVVNVGNFHTLAFQFEGGRFLRLFEHHTGEVTAAQLAAWLGALAAGSITHDAVFADNGHGALVLDSRPLPLAHVAIVGPRRSLLRMPGVPDGGLPASGVPRGGLPAYFAVPHGDQMLVGCYGLLHAVADLEPAWREPIEAALTGGLDRSLW